MKKLTKDEFMEKSNKIHDFKYDYTNSNYINSQLKIKIVCPEHGEFEQFANAHMRGQGCSRCNGGFKYNIKDFISKSNQIHNNFYDYSRSNYVDSYTILKIICPEHGEFKQLPNNHMSGQGCPKCKGKFLTTEEFIKKCNDIHKYKYNYDNITYKGQSSKIKILCKYHGYFIQKASNHLNLKQGCAECAGVKNSNNEDFIKKSISLHGDLYDYSKVYYKNAKTNVDIICKKHGLFLQQPTKHLSGQGCPICKLSKGELFIAKLLTERNVKFITQYKFDNFNLVFDFYLPINNITIEYDGIQHFKPVNHFGGIKAFESQKIRDSKKDRYCMEKNIKLFRIKYTDDIEDSITRITNLCYR
jgi:very-short-patch-repair endonuclease